ncbi:type I-E CRISPR-associated protein Cse1/CasA [Nitrosospira lacus]|uniref:type I-E CRISPR-associated protein Cse1/CasA n=1 Tax=Nitrosospira lacus TaxID=1288494 RepID=UPI00059544FA|nr:type I-E CRISPR-associated protein Cse1/CasA [Nitrosospira lacus]
MTLQYSLLGEPLIRARDVSGGQPIKYNLPRLFVALAHDEVRDFPALRPHQRHPWHAFLVQLAAMALHRAGQDQSFASEQAWRDALLALTPEHPDGAPWCLIAPHDKPAFMQAPVPDGRTSDWKNILYTPDELDMLVTSKNHDLKAARMRQAEPDDWLMGLISLQTQEGFLGAGNYGISRMNGGFANRPALGVVPKGYWGRRWQRDVAALLNHRAEIAEHIGLRVQNGIQLLWLPAWTGDDSLAFSSLDPFYIEICRRIRLILLGGSRSIGAIAKGSKAARVEAEERKGITGDAWMPVDTAAGKALTITSKGFDYQLAAELVFGNKFQRPSAQILDVTDGTEGVVVLAQGITRGQGKTEGYHERRIPVSPKVRMLLMQKPSDLSATIAGERIDAISKIRSVLWTAMATLFDQGAVKDRFSDSAKNKANEFIRSFEQAEDARFFDELNAEIESDDPGGARLQWLLSMADRAEVVLRNAFITGPQSSEQRYRAQSAALSRLHGGLRSDKTLPTLANYYRHLTANKENAHEPV